MPTAVEINLTAEEVVSCLHDLEYKEQFQIVRDWLNDRSPGDLANVVVEVLKESWDTESAQKCADLIAEWKEKS